MEYKVSVIIPVYKVGKFIERCARSLMEQTLTDVEYIFVDDASPDDSINVLHQVLANYPDRCDYVKILTHTENKGLPAARNTGLSVAQGEYIFHCDSDDFVEPDMLEQLCQQAKEIDADIVWCDWWLSFAKNERYIKQPNYATPLDAIKAMLGGAMKYNVWNKLSKRKLYQKNNIVFPEGYGMGEDMTMILLFAYAQRVRYIPKAFYHYIKNNTDAFTQNHSDKHLKDLQYNVDRVERILSTIYGTSLTKEIAFLKLETKFPLLIMGSSTEQYKEWARLYPEANPCIFQNTYISIRSRILEWCAWKKQWWIIKLYYRVVIRLIYGVIYR